jgi:hypothetical protein
MSVRQPWSAAEELLCQTLTEQGRDSAEIAATFASRGIARTQKAIMRIRDRRGWHGKVAESPVTLAPAVRIEGDCLGLFDAHAPAHDADWMNRVIALARSWHIENCVLGGDVIDWQSLSPFGNETDLTARQEIAATRQLVTAVKRSFAKIVEIDGNHEKRINRATASRLQSDSVVNLWLDYNDNVTYSDYEWCEVVSGGVLFRFVHPGNYSGHATIVAKDLCDIYEVNTVCGHDHVWGMALNKSGRYWAIDAGGCCDPGRIAYKRKRMTRHPQFQTGACIVKGSTPILLSPGNIGFYEAL